MGIRFGGDGRRKEVVTRLLHNCHFRDNLAHRKGGERAGPETHRNLGTSLTDCPAQSPAAVWARSAANATLNDASHPGMLYLTIWPHPILPPIAHPRGGRVPLTRRKGLVNLRGGRAPEPPYNVYPTSTAILRWPSIE